jgi:uncharacterized caspase-like protein
MAKVALLIGVSEYGSGLNPLPGAVRDIETVQHVLQPLEMGGFDEVKLLSNPNPPVMREAIETLFSGRTKDDLVLLFFVGHIVQDDSGKLYFATSITCLSPKSELIRVSSIPASFVHDIMNDSPCQRQVVILDCCLGRLCAEEMTANDYSSVDIKTQLGSVGRAILASFTSSQNSFEPEGLGHSVYTRYLVEGIKTGAADLDSNGWISVDELHEYASNKVEAAAPAVKPQFYPIEGKDKILLAKAPIDDPKLKYRKEAENWVSCGEISEAGRYTLDKLAESLQLTSEVCTEIEAEALKPYQEYQEKLQRYKQEFAKAISKDYPLGIQDREELRSLQRSLGLRDEDAAPIEKLMVLRLASLSQSQNNADKLAQLDSETEANSLPSVPSAVLLESTPIPAVQPTNSMPASEVDGSKLAQSDSEREANSLPSVPTVVLPESTQTPVLGPTNPTPASEADASKVAQLDREKEPNSMPSVPSAVPPESKPITVLAATNPTPAVNLSSDLTGSQKTSPRSVSTFPKKFLLPIGIGGALATVALAIGISTRTTVAPPVAPTLTVSSSPNPSPKPSSTATKSDKPSSPSATASPDSKDCTVLVNGNLRSEPAPFRDNVVESLRTPLPVTGKQTKGGWVEVKLSDNKLAWAHRDIISNKEEMDACLAKKGITIQTVEDILPPASSSSPSSSSP